MAKVYQNSSGYALVLLVRKLCARSAHSRQQWQEIHGTIIGCAVAGAWFFGRPGWPAAAAEDCVVVSGGVGVWVVVWEPGCGVYVRGDTGISGGTGIPHAWSPFVYGAAHYLHPGFGFSSNAKI